MQVQPQDFVTQGADAPALDARSLAGCELAAATLRRFGALRLRVTGSSMLPAIRPLDEIAVERCHAHEVRRGEVVLFVQRGRLFVHRVIAVDSRGCIVTRGDTNPTPDEPLLPGQLLGKVVHVRRRGTPIDPGESMRQRLAASFISRSDAARRWFARVHAWRHGVAR